MNKKGITAMLIISLMMAMSAALLARNWLDDRVGQEDTASETSVVVAALQIPFGEKIKASDLRMMELPPHAIPEGSFNDVDDVIDRVASQTIYAGEVVLKGRVPEHPGGSALAATLDQGKRAVTVRVDDVLGVAGFLLPGNRVDVVSSTRNGANRSVESETIISDVKVLAVDQNASPERNGPVIVRAVTLEVTPTQAERLVKASQEGRVQLTLRNPSERDKQAGQSTPVKTKAEKSSEPQVKRQLRQSRPVPRKPRELSVTVIRGTDPSTTTVRE